VNAAKPSIARSLELLERASRVVPGASQTFSKAPQQYVRGVSPMFLARARGSHVWDVDGNEYIDYPTSLGPIILGYADPDVDAAIARQLQDGIIYSLPHPLEVELAELLVEIVPSAEMVRFAKNGSDATAGAVRVARAFTRRDKIACCGYHGWQDWYIATTTRAAGIPSAVRGLTMTFNYNDIGSLERLFADNPDQIAAVIMEPIGVIEPQPGFLEAVAEVTRRHGALLIFDEVVTGFRVALGGAQQHYGVIPDLTACGKAMGNGMPISAIVGRADIMRLFTEIFFSFTFGGEALSLAASLATIRKMRERDVIAHLWRQGAILQDGYNAAAAALGLASRTQCLGLPPHTVMTFLDEGGGTSLELRTLFQQEMIKRGILFLVGFNLSFSHSDEDVRRTLEACRQALGVVADAIAAGDVSRRLEGPLVQPVFRRA
jgi:glutamate-1-semialdehyde-2,1-aminomutase